MIFLVLCVTESTEQLTTFSPQAKQGKMKKGDEGRTKGEACWAFMALSFLGRLSLTCSTAGLEGSLSTATVSYLGYSIRATQKLTRRMGQEEGGGREEGGGAGKTKWILFVT